MRVSNPRSVLTVPFAVLAAVALVGSGTILPGAPAALGVTEGDQPSRQLDSSSGGLLGPLGDDPAFYAYSGLLDVAAGPDGLVAVGATPSGAAAWASVDGVEWTRVPDSTDFDGGWPSNMPVVTHGGPGWVAAGYDGAVSLSEDGLSWERSGRRSKAKKRWEEPTAIATLADGSIVVAGWSPNYHTRIWRSGDGESWPRLRWASRAGTITEIVPLGAGWVGYGHGLGGRVLVSGDGRTAELTEAPASLGNIVAFDDRLYAVKSQKRKYGLWASDDGIAWTRQAPLPEEAAELRAWRLAAANDRLFLLAVADSEGGRVCGWDVVESTAVGWSSPDGETWERLEPRRENRRWRSPAQDAYTIHFVGFGDDDLLAVGDVWSGNGLDTLGPVARTWSGSTAVAAPGADTVTGPLELRRSALLGAPTIPTTPIEGINASGRLGLTQLQDGGVLLASAGDKRTRLLRFSPPDDVASLGRVGRGIQDAAAAETADGRIHVIAPGKAIRSYDPARRRWSTAEARMRAAPNRLSAAPLTDDRVLIASSNPGDGPPRARLDLFEPRAGTLEKMAFPGASQGHAVFPGADGTVMAISGSRIWRLDPEDGWVPGAANPHLAFDAPAASATPLADGRIALLVPEVWLIEHSEEGCEKPGVRVTLLDLYDPATDSWTLAGTLPAGRDRQWVHAAGLPDGGLLVGSDRQSGPMDLALIAAGDTVPQ